MEEGVIMEMGDVRPEAHFPSTPPPPPPLRHLQTIQTFSQCGTDSVVTLLVAAVLLLLLLLLLPQLFLCLQAVIVVRLQCYR